MQRPADLDALAGRLGDGAPLGCARRRHRIPWKARSFSRSPKPTDARSIARRAESEVLVRTRFGPDARTTKIREECLNATGGICYPPTRSRRGEHGTLMKNWYGDTDSEMCSLLDTLGSVKAGPTLNKLKHSMPVIVTTFRPCAVHRGLLGAGAGTVGTMRDAPRDKRAAWCVPKAFPLHKSARPHGSSGAARQASRQNRRGRLSRLPRRSTERQNARYLARRGAMAQAARDAGRQYGQKLMKQATGEEYDRLNGEQLLCKVIAIAYTELHFQPDRSRRKRWAG